MSWVNVCVWAAFGGWALIGSDILLINMDFTVDLAGDSGSIRHTSTGHGLDDQLFNNLIR